MASNAHLNRLSYTRLHSSTNLTGSKSAGATIRDIQDIQLLDFGPTTVEPFLNEDTKYDSGNPIERPARPRKWHRLQGWRVGAALAMVGALLTLLVNVGIAAYGIQHKTTRSTDSSILVELFHGDCRKASQINTYAHLLINVVSTLLLSGSNYCMQCLAAPTRRDVDAAHAKLRWLDIGVPSVRNLKHLSRGRRWLWALLIVSSLPLHLMFNSVFFTSIATNNYNVVFATEGYTTGANFSTANGFNTREFQPPGFKENLTLVQQHVRAGQYERLEKVDCLKAYSADLVTDRRTLVVISSNVSKHDNGAVLGSGNQEYIKPERWYSLYEGYNPYTWLCSDRDAAAFDVKPGKNGYRYCYKYANRLIAHPDKWAPNDWDPEYCLSEKVDGRCSCIINMAIIWIIIACNIIKMVVMGIVAFSNTLDQPLCTIGDAITSFVTSPDPTTENMCLVTREYMVAYNKSLDEDNNQRYREHTFGKDPEHQHFITGGNGWTPPSPQTWQTNNKTRWYHAPSRARWSWAGLFFAACLITVLSLLGRAIGFYTGDKSLSALAAIGLGHPTSQTMITGWAISSMHNRTAAIVLSVLVANTPQIVLSFLYFSVNGICTSMALASEWGCFSYANAMRNGPKTLRTSEPCGQQRSTYFLQLPLRFAVPLIAMSVLLHWLISQSIFIAVVTIYDELGNLSENFAVATCGFSPFAMILVIITGLVMAGGITGIGYFRLGAGMRVVGSCSAAISAACHVRKKGEQRWELVEGPLVWGDVREVVGDSEGRFVNELDDAVRHCAFASAVRNSTWGDCVGPPIDGKKYA